MNVKSVFIVGSGTMGAGIAQVGIQSGVEVWLNDSDLTALEKARASITDRLEQKAAKGKMSKDEEAACVNRLHTTAKLDPAKGCEIIIEAVYENLDAKVDVFQKLEQICGAETVFASNTSSLSITAIAGRLKQPGRLIGMHFFSPPPVMKLLEITRGLQTSDEAYQAALLMGEKFEKVVITAKDTPGFIVNRILDPMVNSAVQMLDEGIGTVDSIDKAMKFACNHPMGPLELADLMGIEILYAVMESLFTELGNPQYHPAPLLKQMIRAGYLGKKSGAGFYLYDGEGRKQEINPVFCKK
jgi:3-hydroxybutyryl-CoA dehydrogenase